MPVQQLLVGNDKMIRTETPPCALIALNVMQTHKELHSARKSNDQLLGYSVKHIKNANNSRRLDIQDALLRTKLQLLPCLEEQFQQVGLLHLHPISWH